MGLLLVCLKCSVDELDAESRGTDASRNSDVLGECVLNEKESPITTA
jgi:hypothetical protein